MLQVLRDGCIAFLITALLPSAAPAQPNSGFSEHRIVSGGEERSYLLYLPSSRSRESLPLVFSFHGSGGVPQNQVDTTRFDELADQHGFAAVFPAGAFTNSVTARSWNANVEDGVDDVQFALDIIDDVAGMVNIDASRIYVSGMSGGGRISSRLACELSGVLAAAAPVAGLQYPDDCTLQRPIPLITFHGKADMVNHYELSENSRPYWRMGVETALDKWRQANDCSLANEDERLTSTVTLYRWTDCGGDVEMHFYAIDDGGHTWPRATNEGVDASELIWEFFSRHRLQ